VFIKQINIKRKTNTFTALAFLIKWKLITTIIVHQNLQCLKWKINLRIVWHNK